MKQIELRTGVWYNDRPFMLTFPEPWDVVTHWPQTPSALTEQQIEQRMRFPIGQLPLRDLAKGKRAPVVIVDDLARPTPVSKVMPCVLKEFEAAGLDPQDITIVVATGTHGHQDAAALRNKLGRQAYDQCHVVVHDDQRDTRFVGTTTFGTPVYVNRRVRDADFIMGVGGVYPQHTTGFGGGAKLILGVLGRKSIRTLHFRHKSVGGTYDIDNDFRKDVTEISRMVGLNTMYTIHTNDRLEVVNLMCGDHYAYYPQAAQFSKQRYTAPLPDDADVVIVNSYPSDVSYTFVRKAMKPIRVAPRQAMRIVIGSMHEGIGRHGLFQQGLSERIREYKELYNRILVMEPKVIMQKIIKNLRFRKPGKPSSAGLGVTAVDPIWLFRPAGATTPIQEIEGVRISTSWDAVLKAIEDRFRDRTIRVRIYPCGSLQCLDAAEIQDYSSGD